MADKSSALGGAFGLLIAILVGFALGTILSLYTGDGLPFVLDGIQHHLKLGVKP